MTGERGLIATAESRARTRVFARVIGPFLVLAPGIIAVRAPRMGLIMGAFFENQALVWITGGMLVFLGVLIIALHQYWNSLAAVLVSLFGWFLAIRGLILLAAPQLIEHGGAAVIGVLGLIRLIFGILVLVGAWLTYAGWVVPRDA